jgi:hypothetical protein
MHNSPKTVGSAIFYGVRYICIIAQFAFTVTARTVALRKFALIRLEVLHNSCFSQYNYIPVYTVVNRNVFRFKNVS